MRPYCHLLCPSAPLKSLAFWRYTNQIIIIIINAWKLSKVPVGKCQSFVQEDLKMLMVKRLFYHQVLHVSQPHKFLLHPAASCDIIINQNNIPVGLLTVNRLTGPSIVTGHNY